jgi:hypothetical protein
MPADTPIHTDDLEQLEIEACARPLRRQMPSLKVASASATRSFAIGCSISPAVSRGHLLIRPLSDLRVFSARAALGDVERIYRYFLPLNPGAARRIAEEVFLAGDSLAHFPNRGPAWPPSGDA